VLDEVKPIVEMVEPPTVWVEPRPVVEILKDVPGKITAYVKDMVKTVAR